MSEPSDAVLGRLPERKALQRRVVLSLSIAQLFSGVGNGAGLALGSLLAVELTGSDAFAGAATTAISVAGALAAMPLAGLAMRRGRRIALSTGVALAALGAIGMVLAPVLGSFPLLLVAAALLGVGTAANLQARFAATDLADEATRGRDVGLVVWAITIGAVGGPNLIGPGAALGAALGLPELSGPFLFSLAGMLVALAVLNVGLRPDPLHVLRSASRAVDAVKKSRPGRPSVREGLAALRDYPAARLGIAALVGAHLVMVAVMSMTPVHLKNLAAGEAAAHAGHVAGGGDAVTADVLVVIGFTISLHIAGMYALSPLVGLLADRWGRPRTMLLAQGVFAASLLTSALGRENRVAVAVGLVLLGLGWSMATVSGSAFVSETVPGELRVLVQGAADTLMGAAGAVGAALSGLVLAWVGFAGLNYAAMAVAAIVGVWCLRVPAPTSSLRRP